MLIDGGGLRDDRFDVGKGVVAPFLWKKKIRKIDVLVLTHPDPDHLEGLRFIASHFSIGEFWESGIQTKTEGYRALQETLRRGQVDKRLIHAGTAPLEIGGARISFLNPPARYPHPRESSSFLNNHSLVLKIQFRNITILLTGDIEKEAEFRMIKEGYPLRAHLLKVPHHGSLSSSTVPFLREVAPHYAILSVGERNLGRLPHPEIIHRYEEFGTKLYRTDENGAITILTDGEAIEVEPFLKREGFPTAPLSKR